MSRLLTLFLALAVPFAAPFAARADDLKDIQNREKLAFQKLNGDVNFALQQAKVFEKVDAGKAKKTLDVVLDKVKNSIEISEEQRKTLTGRLQPRITEIGRLVRIQDAADEEAARRTAEKARREQQAAAGNNKTVNDAAGQRIVSTKDQLANIQKLREQQSKGVGGVLNDIALGAIPENGVVSFPKHWDRIVARPSATNKLSEAEKTLLKTLNSTISVDYKGTQFKDVLDDLQVKTGLKILVDENSLKELNIDSSNDPVNLKISKVTVRTILKKVLADRGLGYILADGTVQVVTAQKARETMVVRAYPIGDLVGVGNPQYGPFVNAVIQQNNVNQLIQTIQNSVDPQLWNINGGPGSITFNQATMALIIRAPAEMHYMMGGGGFFK